MYDELLYSHSFLRYVVLFVLILAVSIAKWKWFSNKPYTKKDDKMASVTLIVVHIQILLGLLLYVVSPLVKTAIRQMPEAMSDSLLRFVAVEHIVGMLLVMGLITWGRVRIRKAETDRKKHFTTALFYGLGLLIILINIPWPFRGLGYGWF